MQSSTPTPPPTRWSSAPPHALPRKRNRVALAVLGIAWAAIGVVAGTYVVKHARDARPALAISEPSP
jgi:hypothetical protein